ncbi:putative MSH5, mismatch repair ATPase [Daphnia pulex]|uniref:Putative MSH5, mismatch repair ATPase n=1 Tax=Daphnia pulex TaxID=6669 RepID=E9I1I8_DAPPU|nr:putative MSH5, mismatch repair ATPase [Daphnia pulex]|eukprot:EFX62143.1 putative MSH5, mismatch repair ATPase [Daphnia pulex]
MNTPLTPVFHMNHQGLSTDQSSQPSVASCNTEIGDLTESAQPKQLILSVAWWGGKLGAAYYDIVSHEEIENVSDTSVFRGLFFQLEPQTLIVKQNLDEKRMANIYQSLKNVEVEGDVSLSNGTQFDAVKTVASIKFSVNERASCHLYIVPSSYFNAEADLFNLLSRSYTSIAGATARYRARRHDRDGALDSPEKSVPFRLSGNVTGLSLFGVASKCYSTPGSMCLKELFKRPTCNVETLNERYTVIRYCMDASNVEVVRSFIGILKNITDIKVSLSNIATMRGTFNDWKKLQMTAKNLIALSDKCKILPQHIRLFYNLAESERSSKWYHVVNVIHRLINFQESKRAGRCVVNSGVDEDLDRLKREHSNMQRIYTETVNLEMENLPPFIEQGVIEFFPHVGHCLCLRSWLQKDPNRNLTMAENDVNIPGLELKENVYFKSRRCYELDETFGDFAATIVAHEMSVMLSGSKVVVEHYGALTEGIELAAYLDALLSLSVLSSEFEMVQPELVENVNPCVHIENGRHILLQLVAERFNPNSTYLGGCDERAKRINIISGPNSSGKSIFLKQTALIVYLAQIGCFVPAQRALITPLKHIFVVSHSPETVVTSLSHFGVELSMMSMASRMATSHSLVILDEFGIGSSHVDGSAMFISCMEHWMKQSDKSPLLLVATHLHNAVEYLSRHTWVLQNTRFLSMGYFLDEEQLVFLYQLIEDMCTNSFPLSVAYASGLPNFVIKRAQEMLKAVDSVGNMTPNNLIWNDAKCSTLRRISESFFATDSWNVDDLKQFTRRNILGCWSSVPKN